VDLQSQDDRAGHNRNVSVHSGMGQLLNARSHALCFSVHSGSGAIVRDVPAGEYSALDLAQAKDAAGPGKNRQFGSSLIMPDSHYDGNNEQTRIVAEQLFTVWETRQQGSLKKFVSGSVPAWIACFLSLGGLVWNAAVISRDVAQNTEDIKELKQGNVGERLVRIETKIDQLTEQAKETKEVKK
jgi:hypothetical protein